MRRSRHLAALALAILLVAPAAAQDSASDPLGREILRELIETDTTHSSGDTTVAAKRMAARLVAAGFPESDVQVLAGAARKGNLVARYRGTGAQEPILFLAHLDVVEAKREDWSLDPFVLTERDGYFYGRGTMDDKGGAATLVTAFARLRKEGFIPNRDLILALTADEEGGPDNGLQWLIANHRDLIDAAYCLNFDSGGGEVRDGTIVALDIQAAEKVYVSFRLTVRNPGGHSSLPPEENAIYRLAEGLGRLSALDFPMRTNEVTRAYFTAMAQLAATPAQAEDMRAVGAASIDSAAAERLSAASPFYRALLRTTCVPTLLEGGHAENALPQMARATVNCRLLPGEDPDHVMRAIVDAVADSQIEIVPVKAAIPSPPSPLVPEVLQALDEVASTLWGDVPVVLFMETGATDGLFLRNAGMSVYGVTGIAYELDDVRAHGQDERILVRSYYEGIDFAYRLARRLASP